MISRALLLSSSLLVVIACGDAEESVGGDGDSNVADGGDGNGSSVDRPASSGGDGSAEGASDGEELPLGVVAPTPTDEVLEEAAAERLGSLCEFFQPCGCPGFEYLTVDACEAQFEETTNAAIEEAADLNYNAECVGDVAAGFEALECRGASHAESSLELVRSVGRVTGCKMYYGPAQVGESCTSLELSNGDSCARGLSCSDGTCEVAENSVPVGEECVDTDECELGLACVPFGAESYCTAVPVAGEACLLGLICDIDATCVSGTCESLPRGGEACSQVPHLLTLASCAPGFVCDEGTCKSQPRDGQSCTPSDVFGRPPCAIGYACIDGTCVEEEPAVCAGGPFPLFP